MGCSLPHSSVHGIFQARVLEWVAIPFSGGSSQPRDRTQGLPHCRQMLYCLSHQRSPVSEKSCPSKNWKYKRKRKALSIPLLSWHLLLPFPFTTWFLDRAVCNVCSISSLPTHSPAHTTGSYPHHSTEISHTKLQMISQLLNSMDTMYFPSLYTKIRTDVEKIIYQKKTLDENDNQIHAVSPIFIMGTHLVIYRHISRYI